MKTIKELEKWCLIHGKICVVHRGTLCGFFAE